jgi:hypothetical protein
MGGVYLRTKFESEREWQLANRVLHPGAGKDVRGRETIAEKQTLSK